MTSTFQNNETSPPARRQAPAARVAEVLLILLVFFIVGGDPPPHVNEPHYLGRLKHYWDPQWCAGDLFLESKDTQYLLVWTLGWLSRWLSLPATAWTGRLLVWTLLAWAWQRLSWRLTPRPLAAVLSAALFVTLIERAHLAGEWVVGGVEGKAFAYGFVLLALRELVDWRWGRLALCLGAATAFHPLVGGWSAVVCGGAWLVAEVRKRRRGAFGERLLRDACTTVRERPATIGAMVAAGLLALLGIVPALLLTWNVPDDVVAEASRIYVFERLPHHVALLRLPTEELAARLTRHALLLAALGGVTVAILRRRGATNEAAAVRPGDALPLVGYAWGAVLLAAIGLAIELTLWNQPMLAARLQRYYWYRLTDFAAPMAVALCTATLIVSGLQRRRGWGTSALLAALLFAGWHLADTARERLLNPVPPADARMADFPAWVEVCDWIADNTPRDALFLTPRMNVSFKWRAGRAEVVTRKDIPQDARSIVQWHRRLKDIYYREDVRGRETPVRSLSRLGTERVREVALAYGADFVLTDRVQLLGLPRVFWNEEYVVYRTSE